MRYATPLKSPITGCDFLCTNYFLRIWLHSKEPNIRSKIGVNINLRFFLAGTAHTQTHLNLRWWESGSHNLGSRRAK